jgi:hypothetical protein
MRGPLGGRFTSWFHRRGNAAPGSDAISERRQRFLHAKERLPTPGQSTQARDQAVAAFKTWLDQQFVVARVALRGKARLLELLGLR